MNNIILIPPCDTYGDIFSIISMMYFLTKYYEKIFLLINTTHRSLIEYYLLYFSRSPLLNNKIFIIEKNNISTLLNQSEYGKFHVCDIFTGNWNSPSTILKNNNKINPKYYFNTENPLYKHLKIDNEYISYPNITLPLKTPEINHQVYYKLIGLNNNVRMNYFDYTRDLNMEDKVKKEIKQRFNISENEKYNIIYTSVVENPDLSKYIENTYKNINIHYLVKFPGWLFSLIEEAESIHLIEGNIVNFIYHCQYKKIININKDIYFHVWLRNRKFDYNLKNAWEMMTTPKLDNWTFIY